MHEKSVLTLEFPKVLALVAGEAGFSVGRERVLALQPSPHLTEADRREVARSGELSERVRVACAASRDPTLH